MLQWQRVPCHFVQQERATFRRLCLDDGLMACLLEECIWSVLKQFDSQLVLPVSGFDIAEEPASLADAHAIGEEVVGIPCACWPTVYSWWSTSSLVIYQAVTWVRKVIWNASLCLCWCYMLVPHLLQSSASGLQRLCSTCRL